MKLNRLLAIAALAAVSTSPAFAATFSIDFEKSWDYSNGDVNDYYNAGTAADGSSGGPNLGVSFVNISGLSNDDFFSYYSKTTSAQGVAYAHDTGASVNVAGGVDGSLNFLQFEYSSKVAVTGAVKAYDSNGLLIGLLNLAANDAGDYSTWSFATFAFTGTAVRFDFTATGDGAYVGLDNIRTAPVPVPAALFLFAPAAAALRLRRKFA